MSKRIGVLFLALVILFSITACSSPSASSPAPSGAGSAKPAKTTLNIAIANDPGTLDICGSPGNSAWDQISYNIYDFLFTLDNNNKEVPLLAESWDKKDDLTYVFHLRKGVKFSDGTPFKASDVLASFNFYKTNPSGKMIVASIDWEKTKVIDDNTIQVAFISPSVAVFGQMNYIRITSEAAIKNPDAMKTKPVGTGAYMLKEWVTGTSMTLVKNPNYWGTKGVLETAVYKVITDASQRTNALLAGNVDLIIQTSPNDIEVIKKDGKFTVTTFSNSQCDSLLFNCSDRSVMKNADLRKTVAYATDKAGIQKVAYNGISKIATAPVPSNFRDYDKNWQIFDNYYEFNMEKAKASLAKSGVPAGTTLTIISNGSNEQMKSAQVIQANLIKLGLNAKITTFDPSVYQKNILDPNATWDICLLGMGSPQLVVADMYLAYFLNQPYGFFAATAPDFVAAVKDANKISTLEQEKGVAKKLIDMEVAALPHFAYMEMPITDSYSNSLQGFTVWYTRMVPIRFLSFK